MSFLFLRLILFCFGLAAVMTAGALAVFGPSVTAEFFRPFAEILIGDGRMITDLQTRNVDSEFRFFSVIFMAYGALMLHCAVHLERYAQRVLFLALVLFLAGLARFWSFISVGPPHGVFIILMWIELGVPVIILMLRQSAIKRFLR